jgi:hypothetical protein
MTLQFPKEHKKVFPKNKYIKYPLKIKMMWCFESELHKLWEKMINRPDLIKMYGKDLKSDDADYIIVVNDSQEYEPTQKNLSKTIFIKMEPSWYNSFWEKIDPIRLKAKWDHRDIDNYNLVEWHLPYTSEELKALNCTKTKGDTISSILSNKNFYPLQNIRINFALKAQHCMDWDAYGMSRNLPWKKFMGELPFHDKRNALVPYKYSFACENNIIPGYITEKLYDCIMCETLCFYSGPHNVNELINPQAYICIDVTNYEQTIFIIQEAIKSQQWEKRRNCIRQAKFYILDNLALFPRLCRLLKIYG